MRLDSLQLRDFRVFSGEHVIDLTPRKKYGKTRPVLLFGGLNGSGKTTILTAIRLAVYGKQALGPSTSFKEYERFLAEAIHRDPNALVNPGSAAVGLTFTHSNLGKVSQYQVVREWTTKGKRVEETLILSQDGQEIPELTYEQAQSFLNELIPAGVSDLFFFDGEKIAELAEEEGNVALGQAIKRLLGLDLVERLSTDLNLYIRRQCTDVAPERIRQTLREHEAKYTELHQQITTLQSERGELVNEIRFHEKRLVEIEQHFSAKGGAWATERPRLLERLQLLEKQRSEVEVDIREALGGLYPLSLAPNLLRLVGDQINKEKRHRDHQVVSSALASHVQRLKVALSDILPLPLQATIHAAVDATLGEVVAETAPSESDVPMLHDLGDTQSSFIQGLIHDACTKVPGTIAKLHRKLEAIEGEMSQVALQIDRAPDDTAIAGDLARLKDEQAIIAALQERHRTLTERLRQLTWQAIELTRQMRKIESQALGAERAGTAITLATRSRSLLADFSSQMKKHKIRELETQFRESFLRLARKDDILLRAEIDPDTFEVCLYGPNDKAIARKRLSAGEKQIYAIAMLESLAKTSGRALPMIIDTPLGRLDSKHREKLIRHYFPTASHQVIILSTDTEVDEKFYSELAPYVSHAFHIVYDQASHASVAIEGYFWKQQESAIEYAT